jgi:hypothetical protein
MIREAPRISSWSLMASEEMAVEWDGNGDAGAWNLSTLTRLAIRVPTLPFNTRPGLTGHLAYLLDRDTEEIQVMDLDSGALLSWWPHGASIDNWLTVGTERIWLTTSEGLVEAYPTFPIPS